MRTKVLMAMLMGASIAGASGAMAQGSRAVPKNASEAIVVNARSVAVTGLEITSAKGEKVGTLKKAIEPGKRQVFKLFRRAMAASSPSPLPSRMTRRIRADRAGSLRRQDHPLHGLRI